MNKKNMRQVGKACVEDWIQYVEDYDIVPSENLTELSKQFAAWAVAWVWCDAEDNDDPEEQRELLSKIFEMVLPQGSDKILKKIVDKVLGAYRS